MNSRKKLVLKTTLLLVLFAAAVSCTGREENKIKTVSPRTGRDAGDRGNQKPDPKALTEQDKFVMKLNSGLKISHEIFAELWVHLWEDRFSRPTSVFQEVLQTLESHRDVRTNHYNLENNQCPGKRSQLQFNMASDGKSVSSLSLKVGSCGPAVNWREVAGFTVTTKGEIRWDFANEFLVRGAGPHLSANKNLTRCTALYLDAKRLKELECDGIGQSRDAETHILFSTLEYVRGSDKLVVAKGKKYRNNQEACTQEKHCTVISVPAEGVIEVIETLGSGVAVKTQLETTHAEQKLVTEPPKADKPNVVNPADLNIMGEPLSANDSEEKDTNQNDSNQKVSGPKAIEASQDFR